MIRVLVAEDQAMVLGALSALLDLEDDIEVIAQARDGAEALPTRRTPGAGCRAHRHRDAAGDRAGAGGEAGRAPHARHHPHHLRPSRLSAPGT